MIIGIHGKISSGKDTVAKMLQYMLMHDDTVHSYHHFLAFSKADTGRVQIKRFAGALKEIVAILTGCNITDLESEVFKNSVIPGWDRSIKDAREWLEMKGIRGAGDGHEEEIFSMARKMGFKFERTYREFLQELGTNVFRMHLHEDTWVKALMSKYKPEFTWLIPDLRFPNEAMAILDHDGYLIKVHRSMIKYSDHISETALDNFSNWHFEIDNNSTLEHLFNQILIIYNKLQHENSSRTTRFNRPLQNPPDGAGY